MIKISTVIKTDINFKIDEDLLIKFLQTDRSTAIATRALEIAKDVEKILKPKFIFRKLNIHNVDRSNVTIGSNEFNSKVLAHHLKDESTVFAFIVTCGKDISNYMNTISDPLEVYILDQIAYMGYLTALKNMQETLMKDFNVDKYISFAPGSILDWDVIEVKKIFKLFDGEEDRLGIKVLDSGLVDPLKSITGLLIQSDDDFHSCIICKKLDCPERKSEFNEEKYIEAINL